MDSNLADLIVERKKEKEIPINFIVRQPTIEEAFRAAFEAVIASDLDRRESLEKISESVTKTEIRLDKIIPAGMTPTADPVVGRFPEEADMRGKAVL